MGETGALLNTRGSGVRASSGMLRGEETPRTVCAGGVEPPPPQLHGPRLARAGPGPVARPVVAVRRPEAGLEGAERQAGVHQVARAVLVLEPGDMAPLVDDDLAPELHAHVPDLPGARP